MGDEPHTSESSDETISRLNKALLEKAEEINELNEELVLLSSEYDGLQATAAELSVQNTLLQENISVLNEQNGILQSGINEQNVILQAGLEELETTTAELVTLHEDILKDTAKLQFSFSVLLSILILGVVVFVFKAFYKFISSFF